MKPRLVVGVFEVFAREGAGTEMLGWIESEGVGAFKWTAYAFEMVSQGRRRGIEAAIALVAEAHDLKPHQVRTVAARFVVYFGRKLVGWVENNGPGSWTWLMDGGETISPPPECSDSYGTYRRAVSSLVHAWRKHGQLGVR